ncbi:MAG: hypothetical protein JWL89_714 [Candidatus Saccharibacteria bacterium]|jgi:hypothetical protein|nr:hypothetical protein [Candidatus Saccharibacteria bacterium]
MKKFLIISSVVASLLYCGFFAQTAFAALNRSTDNTCRNDDLNYFPYGMFCGSAPVTSPQQQAYLDTPNGLAGGADFSTAQGLVASSVSSIHFNAHYDQANTPSKGSEVFAWVTIDGGGGNIVTNSTVTNTSATKATCPGIGAPDYAPVFNSRDPQPDGNNGPDASPIAYTDAAHGFENCGTSGRMLYWKNASSGANYGFDLNLPQGRTGDFCVRLNVSLRLSGGENYFTGINPGNSYGSYEDQNSVASHVAKQSTPRCYHVYDNIPKGNLFLLSCSVFSTTGAHDPDHPGEAVFFRLKHLPNYPASNSSNYTSGAFSTDTSGGGFGGATISPGGWYLLEVLDPDVAGVPGYDPWMGVALKQAGPGVDCTPPEIEPSANRAMDCNIMRIDDLFDPNDNGSGLFWEVLLFDGQGANRKPRVYYSGHNGDHANIDIPVNQNATQDNVNDGWSADLIIYNFAKGADSSGPGDTKYIQTVNSPAPCYAAHCTAAIQASTPIQGRPNGVKASNPFNLLVTIYNDGPGDLPSSVIKDGTGETIYLTSTVNANPNFPNQAGHSAAIAPGGSAVVAMPYTAPGSIGNYNIDPYPDYNGLFSIGARCPTTVTVYKHFTLTPHAKIATNAAMTEFNNEDPIQLYYHTWLTDDEHISDGQGGLPATTARFLSKKDTYFLDPPKYDTDRFMRNGSGGCPPSSSNPCKDYGVQGPFVIPTSDKYQAGDQYCAYLSVNNHIGWLGPGDDIVNLGSTETQDCPHVTNNATFKVLGANVWAGGDFSEVTAGRCVGGGELAGWFNNTNSGTYSWGSSTALSAIALVKDVGFASAQTVATRSPTDLTFANTTTKLQADYSPALGGDFGSTVSHCLTSVRAPLGAGSFGGGSVSGLDGGYNAGSNTTVDGGQINPGHNVSIFVNGDVYISDNITYNTGSWTKDNIPSFVLHASGNIYIAPNVTQLDGLYVAEQRLNPVDGKPIPNTGSTIYTCGTAYAPVPQGAIHGTCTNQLTVHGSFVADHVNLMRTYGTMRDEKPGIGILDPGHAASGQSIPFYRFSCPGGAPPLGKHQYSTKLTGGTSPSCSPERTAGYILPPTQLPPAGTAIPLYAQGTGSIFNPRLVLSTNYAYLSSLPNFGGAPSLVGYVPVNGTPGTTGIHSYTSNSSPFDFYSSGPGSDSFVNNPGVTDHGVAFNLYNAPNQGGTYQQDPVYGGVAAPTSLNCSNTGTPSFSRLRLNGGPATCAAEVFDFSPEMYLSNQAICATSACMNPPDFDAITSLPPVL